jgi:Type II CAAX prenyl endopeptidase Rce1-like
MAQASKSYILGELSTETGGPVTDKTSPGPDNRSKLVLGLQMAVVYGLIELALWTPIGPANSLTIILAAICVLWLALRGPFSAREMGLGVPSLAGSTWTVAGGVILAAMVPLLAAVLGDNSTPRHPLPLHQAWQYAVWALAQQFVLESFFFVRMESLMGGRWAVPVTAILFSAAHIPNPILTFTSLVGGLFFCAMFRRYRTIIPLGLVHAGLGLLLAASFSDAVLHHMRVGIGYILFHA